MGAFLFKAFWIRTNLNMPTPDLRSSRFRGLGLLFLRLGGGLYLAVAHGWPKIAGTLGEEGWMASAAETLGPGLPTLLFSLIAVALELFGGLLAALGFFSRTVSALLVLYVLGAYLIGLGIGSIERTLVCGGVFLILLLTGPGRYSVDEYLTPTGEYVVVNSTERSAEGS